MSLLINKKLLALSLTALLAACGGGGGSSSSDSDTSSTEGGSGQGSSGGDQGSSGDDNTPISDNVGTTVVIGEVEVTDLGFASLTAVDVTLPEAMNNAKEVYQLAHYIARTDGEQDEDNIDIPIRSYVATCATGSDIPRMFVSTTLSEGTSASDTTYGSVYELQYNPDTSSFDQTGNATILNQCYESHGIAVSQDCSRVAVLCNTEYRAHERYDIQGDLVEQYGTTYMRMEDNLDKVEGTDAEEKYNDQIWLMEWDNESLSETPDTYVVSKIHGGTHLGTQELIYVDTDSEGRASYAFTASARVFDDGGGSHYSAGLTVINRNDWSLNMGGSDNRGWDWACGNGHVVNIRAFYNPANESYGALCTSDWNDWMGSARGQLGTIAIKMEWSDFFEGYFNHFVPSTSAMVSNGGGHTVVPLDENTNLSVIVSPKYIEDSDMEQFLSDEVGVDTSSGDSFDQDCAGYESTNCFLSYMAYATDYPIISRQALYSGDGLDASSLTRVGIAKTDGSGSISGEGYNWLVEDNDCQISDPQLIDLKNGRYLFGYAKFQCISDNLSYDRIYSANGSKRLLVPKSYYVMEIDADMNILEGPIELPNYGWGGLDEPMYLGNGKVAWTYIKNPTFDNYVSGQQNIWQAMIYHSNSVN
ncbi:hypothetical protein BTJ40_16595 [Microbulbifer sp. A4B17]|uniref:hypothetical protein n=1 Tax=Microbulbifer sp. A4B17 TaxID=359370 RepID=UPI000D52BF1E|nr:hypothetical protein [Microbulbifer sp. A4B17]AWF82315.1 hypothetical protein BTJ40_16595 [Microbulbifer sp. A4B17]